MKVHRLLVSSFAAILFAAALPASSGAAQPLPCPRADTFGAEFFDFFPASVRRRIRDSRCMLVRVPLDHAGGTPGAIDIFVRRVPSQTTARRGALAVLEGGPGQSASSGTIELIASLAPIARDREFVLMDQRGTGHSGLLLCPSLERAVTGPVGPAVQGCAASLGPRRAFYTTRDAADDIELVRRDLGLGPLALLGTSYGTKLALVYAQQHPDGVERLLLDSVVPTDGPDPYMRDIFAAVPRVLKSLCANGACRPATPDPVGDLAALVKRLAAAPLRGMVVGSDGKRRARRLGRLRLLRIMLTGDLLPPLRSDLPSSVRAALLGDETPLLRLASRVSAGEGAEPPSAFSSALFAATSCEEGPLPWELTDPFSHRWGRTIGQASSIPDASFFPFDRATGRASDTLRLCAHWPANGPARKPSSAPLPDVPALLLSGADDLRTPSEEAARVSRQLPRSKTLTMPFTGHGVLVGDISGCAELAARNFLANGPTPACPPEGQKVAELLAHSPLLAPTPLPPLSLAAVPAARGVPGRAGRTATAVELTLTDWFKQLFSSFGALVSGKTAFGGLRGGRFDFLDGFDRYSYVPGVEVTSHFLKRLFRELRRAARRGGGGSLDDFRIQLRITGKAAAHGRLVLDSKGKLSGRLGGRRVHARFLGAAPFASPTVPPLTIAGCCRFIR